MRGMAGPLHLPHQFLEKIKIGHFHKKIACVATVTSNHKYA